MLLSPVTSTEKEAADNNNCHRGFSVSMVRSFEASFRVRYFDQLVMFYRVRILFK